MGLFDKFKSGKVITPQERRSNTIEQLEKSGIAYNPNLPLLEPSEAVKLKDIGEIKKRALGSMLSIQLACSISNGEDYAEALSFVMRYLEEWNLSVDDLLPKERLLIQNKHTKEGCTEELKKQTVVDVAWTYEAYWSLIWALDLISDKELKDASKVCNTERAMAVSQLIPELDLKLRNIEKILDMLDLFYCYHWACVEKRINPDTKIGRLNPEVVYERRRGLEWLISAEKDWNDISLDT